MKNVYFFLWLVLVSMCSIRPYAAADTLFLRDNLQKALPGDYLVTAQHKNYTMLIIRSKDADVIGIDEITLPMAKKPKDKTFSWRKWVGQGAPGNTNWIMYRIHLPSGSIQNTFSFTKKEWVSIPESQNFLSTLLNLNLQPISPRERKKIGPPPSSDSMDRRPVWQPQMIVDGTLIKGVLFDAFRTYWPKDQTELSGRLIEVYLPKDNERYPGYFPYWLEVSGMIGKAKVRIVDSGHNIFSPQ